MISETMRIIKAAIWTVFWVAMLAALVYFGTGCATVEASKKNRERIEETWNSFWLLHDINKIIQEEDTNE